MGQLEKLMKIFFLLSAASLYAATTVNYVTAIIPPYAEYDQNKQLIGTGVSAVKCVMDKLNRGYHIEVVPWKRAQLMVERVEKDAFFVASENDERNKYAKFSGTLIPGKWEFFGLTKEALEKKDRSIGVFSGTNMALWLKNNHKKLGVKNIIYRENGLELIELLKLKRVDGLLLREDMYQRYVRDDHKYLKITYKKLAKNRDLGVYFAKSFVKKEKEFVERFSRNSLNCQPKAI